MTIDNNTNLFDFDDTTISFSSDICISKVDEFLDALCLHCDSSSKLYAANMSFNELPFEIRKHIMSKAIDDNIPECTLIRNLILLTKTNCQLTDSLFKLDTVIVNTLEEFLDMKLELADKLKKFKTDVTFWLLSCLKSMSAVELNFLSNSKPLPKNMLIAIAASDLMTLSGIMSNSSNVNTSELALVENAYPIIATLVRKQQLADTLMKVFQQDE